MAPIINAIIAARILKTDEFITNIGMGQNLIKVNPPSIPKKIGPKNSVIFGISSILNLLMKWPKFVILSSLDEVESTLLASAFTIIDLNFTILKLWMPLRVLNLITCFKRSKK